MNPFEPSLSTCIGKTRHCVERALARMVALEKQQIDSGNYADVEKTKKRLERLYVTREELARMEIDHRWEQ